MKYLLIPTLLLITSSLAFANKEESIKNIIIYDDFTTWIDSGDALFDWEKIVKSSPKKAVTTNKIKNDFAGNEVAANRDYANQWVRLKGTVKNVKLDKDGKMYADLTENYVNFKAYISDSEFAASLQPNQKVDMYCFNATASSATGGRIIATAAKLINQKGSGRVLVSICAAGGQGVTAIIEK